MRNGGEKQQSGQSSKSFHDITPRVLWILAFVTVNVETAIGEAQRARGREGRAVRWHAELLGIPKLRLERFRAGSRAAQWQCWATAWRPQSPLSSAAGKCARQTAQPSGRRKSGAAARGR